MNFSVRSTLKKLLVGVLATELGKPVTYLNIRVARRSLRSFVTLRPEADPENSTDPFVEKQSITPTIVSNNDIRTMLKSSKSHALKY